MRRARPPLAVVDIGSNSARIVVYDREPGGHLRIVASARSSLRLVEGIVERRAIGAEAMTRAAEAFTDFRAIAGGAGARDVRVYATAAVREAADQDLFARMVRRTLGTDLTVLDADREAFYGFHGALRGLDARTGVLFDLGGGSLQITEFRHRKRLRSWSLPLGALRLSRKFLHRDPPAEKEIRALRAHIDRRLDGLALEPLGPGERLVGTGGTVRNLAKIERFRIEAAVPRLHGHELASLADIEAQLCDASSRKRSRVLGLSRDRTDSIVAGAVVVERMQRRVQAGTILVSGQGLREGLAYAALGELDAGLAAVRERSIQALLSRFRGVEAAHGERRAELARALFARLSSAEGESRRPFGEALAEAARVLDIGRAVDFFDRHEHAARIVLASELDGFSQVEVARIAAVLHVADEEGIALETFAPLVTRGEHRTIERAAVVLLLADDLLARAQRGVVPAVRVTVRSDTVTIRTRGVRAWRSRGLGDRFERAFARQLKIQIG